jgi:MFS family permease
MTRSRWTIPLILAVTVFVHYLDRNNLAIVLPQVAREFGWDNRQIGQYGNLLLGAFYCDLRHVAQVILSPLAERWGVKRSLMASVVGFSVCTMLFYPLGGSLGALIALRLLLGAAESVHMPMNSALVGRWFAPHERGRANSVYVAGILVALAVAPLIVVPLAERFGWRATFLLLGAAGMAISLPLVARYISDQPPGWQPSQAHGARLAWRDALRAYGARDPLAFWLYLAAGVCNAFCVFGILNWLPSYLNRTRGIPFGELSLPLFGVFLAGIVGVFFWAYWGDRTGRRVPFASVGLLLAGLCVLLTARCGRERGGDCAAGAGCVPAEQFQRAGVRDFAGHAACRACGRGHGALQRHNRAAGRGRRLVHSGHAGRAHGRLPGGHSQRRRRRVASEPAVGAACLAKVAKG